MNQTSEKDREWTGSGEGRPEEADRTGGGNASGEGTPAKNGRQDGRDRLREDYEKLKKRYTLMVRRFSLVTGGLVLLVVLVFISGRMGFLSSSSASHAGTESTVPDTGITTEPGHSEESPETAATVTAAASESGTEENLGKDTAETGGKPGTGPAGTDAPEPTVTEAPTATPVPTEAPDDGQAWVPADHASEQTGGILIEPIEIQMVSAGTTYDPMQVDWENVRNYFQAFEISEGDEVHARILGKSLPADAGIALSDLRYLKMLHFNFDGQVQVGEMIVNTAIAEDVLDVFCSLFAERYEINKMVLIDDYWTGDPITTDDASVADDNTCCFCYRNSVRGSSLSIHASGRGIELNPLENPYVYSEDGNKTCRVEASRAYISGRSADQAHVITWDDPAVRIFREKGFTWGGEWDSPTVYQVFQKTA